MNNLLLLNKYSSFQFVAPSYYRRFKENVFDFYEQLSNEYLSIPKIDVPVIFDYHFDDRLYNLAKDIYYDIELPGEDVFPNNTEDWEDHHFDNALDYFIDNESRILDEFAEDVVTLLNQHQITYTTEDYHEVFTIHNPVIVEVW